jgi:hypothetical protein
MTNEAVKALTQIRALRKYPAALPQKELAEQTLLSKLNLTDLTIVITALDRDEVTNG